MHADRLTGYAATLGLEATKRELMGNVTAQQNCLTNLFGLPQCWSCLTPTPKGVGNTLISLTVPKWGICNHYAN